MDPNSIDLEDLSKNFEYFKIASEIDTLTDIDQVKNMAKAFCKLYFKQQEVVSDLVKP
jgi:hypothetical protein